MPKPPIGSSTFEVRWSIRSNQVARANPGTKDSGNHSAQTLNDNTVAIPSVQQTAPQAMLAVGARAFERMLKRRRRQFQK